VDDVVTLVGSRDALARAIDLLGESTVLARASEEPA
jgi:hypothetical protein